MRATWRVESAIPMCRIVMAWTSYCSKRFNAQKALALLRQLRMFPSKLLNQSRA